MAHLTPTFDGEPVSGEVVPHTLLVDCRRRDPGLAGARIGCDVGQFEAYVVHLWASARVMAR